MHNYNERYISFIVSDRSEIVFFELYYPKAEEKLNKKINAMKEMGKQKQKQNNSICCS